MRLLLNATHHARASSHVACMGLVDLPTFKTYFARSLIRSRVSGRMRREWSSGDA
jgi:hypothetical protein